MIKRNNVFLKNTNINNINFKKSIFLNEETYLDYFNRLARIAMTMFEWVNLPPSMDARFLEYTLFWDGQATLLYDDKYGYINTRCSTSGTFNIYGLPNSFHCYSYGYDTNRLLYCGLNPITTNKLNEECILVMNNMERIPTWVTLDLYAYRLTEAERTADINIKRTKTPYFTSL